MKDPKPLFGYCAFDPSGLGDIDYLRRNVASCRSAVSNVTGIAWPKQSAKGWSVLRVSVVRAADQPVEVPHSLQPAPMRQPLAASAGPPFAAGLFRCGSPGTHP